MTDRCETCPYLATTGCIIYVLGGNWHCARENLDGQDIVEVRTYTTEVRAYTTTVLEATE